MGDPKDQSRDEAPATRADDLEPSQRGYGSGGAGYGGAGTGAGQGEPGSGGAGRPDERPAGQAGSVYDPGSGPEPGEVQGPDDAPQIEASPEDGESQDEIVLSSTNTRVPSDVAGQESTGTNDKPGAGL